MEKISNKVLFTILLGEVLAIICAFILTGKSDYLWIIAAVLAVITVLTFYKCISRINQFIFSLKEERRLRELECESRENHLMKQIVEEIGQKGERISEKIDIICASQERMIEKNDLFCQELSETVRKIDENSNKIISKMKDEISLGLNTLTQNIESACNDTTEEMNRAIDLFTEKYEHALEEMTSCQIKQAEEWKSSTVEIINNSKAAVSTLISNVEEKIRQNSDLGNKVLEKNILETKAAVSTIVVDSKDLLQKQYIRLEELNKKLSERTKEYMQQLMDQIIAVSSSNIDEMKLSCENVLNITAERIVSENEETGNKRTEAFENSLKELENTYNSIISEHIKALEEQINDSITMFMAENKSALKTNNEKVSELISSERKFVSEIESNNAKLHETITSAFEKYSKSVEQNITDIKNVMDQGINTGSQNAIESINSLSKVNSETVSSFADELKIYSDSIIEKNAIAMGNVQADNYKKLQELSDQVSGYISENKKFISFCRNINDSLRNSINQMITDRKKFINDLNILSDNHLGSLDANMKSKIQNMVEQLQTLNKENAKMFSDAMSEYREKFVEASASAIAEVQEDNVSSITDANKKISELALNLKGFQEDISATLKILKGIIEDGVSEQKEQDEEFDSAMNELVDKKLSEYNSKLQEYNDYIETLGEKITEVMDACHNNTTKYEETLKFIVEAQREANSLNNKDVELLKTFMER